MRKLCAGIMALMLFCITAFGQTTEVTGKVTDANGMPLPNASVREKGGKNGVQSATDGTFKIKVKKGAALVISEVGFETKEVVASGNLNISLATDTKTLNEVVVTALGIKRQPKQLGYSTAIIGNADINEAHVTNPVTGLAGKVSGLSIQLADNGVDPQVRVTLRGNRSILGNNQALIVVDGVPVSNDFLARINPNDIENVTVLKGSSASALYGSEASNGVLIITTFKGRKGVPKVSFSSTVSSESISYMPKLQDQFGSYGGEPAGAILGVNTGDPTKIYYPYENQSFGPRYNGQMVPLGGPVRIFRADGTYFDSTKMVPYSAVPGGKKAFFDNGLTYNNALSLSAGDETSTFYLGYQNVTTKGIVPGDKSNRNAFRIATSKTIGRFTAETNFGYTLEKVDQAGGSYFQNRPVYWTVINTPQHADLRNYRNWQTDPFASPDGFFDAYYGNPYWQIDQARNVANKNDLIGNITLSFKITDWLAASYNANISRQDYTFKGTQKGYQFADWAIADPWQAGTIPSSVKNLLPSLTDAVGYQQRIGGRFLLNGNRKFGDFDLKVTLGQEVYKKRTNYQTDYSGSLVSNLFNISNISGIPSVGQTLIEQGESSVFGEVNLGYKDYLFVGFTGRNDWTSLLSPANRSIFYPSGNVSFVFTDAFPSLKSDRFLSYGKLRGAWSRTGNINVSPYSLATTGSQANGFPYGNQVGFTIGDVYANPNLKPEFTEEKEIGLELTFLKNRVNFTAAVYQSTTTNQTLPASLSYATGYQSAYINVGSMKNQGIELDLSVKILNRPKSFNWDISGNFSYNKNTVSGLSGDQNVYSTGLTQTPYVQNANVTAVSDIFAVNGNPYPYIKESDWNRDDQGRIIVDPTTGYPTKAAAVKGFGTTVAPYKVGFKNTFAYRGFSLNVVMDASLGGVIYNAIGNSLDFTGNSWNSAQYGRQPFVIPNSSILSGGKYVANTNVVTQDGNWNFWANTWGNANEQYITSADYLKLREVSLSYDLPRSVCQKIKFLKAASLSVSGRNLLMIRPKDNVWTDPEFSAAGTNNTVGVTNIYQTPPTRIVSATLNVTF